MYNILFGRLTPSNKLYIIQTKVGVNDIEITKNFLPLALLKAS